MTATANILPNPEHRASHGHSPGWTCLRSFRRDQDGIAAVEFGLVALPFFALLFAILETALVFWSTQVLETAVANASRTIYTGQFQSTNDQNSPDIGTKFKAEVCKNITALFACDTPSVRVDVRRFTPGTPPPDVIDKDTKQINEAAFGYQTTKASDIVLVRVAVEYPVFVSLMNSNQANLANGKRLLMGSATFRNEPF
jgi:Flp pilus assembly protein TadG